MRLAQRRGADGVLPVGELRRRRGDVAVVVEVVPERLRHVVHDVLAEGVHGELEMHVQAGQIAQIEAGGQLQARGDAELAAAHADHQQAGGLRAETEILRADVDADIGEHRQALRLRQAEIEHAIGLHQIEQVQVGLAEHPQQLLVVHQHDGLGRIASIDGVARIDDVIVRIVVAVDRQRHVAPGAPGEIDGDEAEGDAGVVERDGAGHRITRIAGAEAGAQTGVEIQAQILGIEHDVFGRADQADVLDAGLCRQVHADVQPIEADHQFLGDDDAQIQVADRQADGAVVDRVVLVDTAVAVAVPEITVAAGWHADEAVGVVDADGQRGDDGALAVGQRDRLGALLGERHGPGQLHETGQVDLGITDLGLDDLLGEIQEHGVVAAGRQHEAGAVDLAVGIAVLFRLQQAVAVDVLAVVLEAVAELVVDRRRPEQLQAGVDHGRHGRLRNRPVEGVDVDFDILGAHRQDVLIDADQAGVTHGCLGADELGRVVLHPRDQVEQPRLHDRQTEIDVVDHQADRALVDVVGQAVGQVGAGIDVDRADQIGAVAVRSADAGEAGQVGATDGHRLHLQWQRIQRGAQHLAQLFGDRCQSAQVHGDVVDLAHAERQRAAQVQEFRDLDLGQTDVDADQVVATQIQIHRLAAGLDPEARRHRRIAARSRLFRERGAEVGGRAHHAAEQLAALHHLDGDVAGAQFEHIAEAVGADLVDVRLQGVEVFGLQLADDGQFQVGLHDGQRQVQVFHAEAGDVLAIESGIHVDVTDADERGDVGGAQRHAVEGDAAHARIIGRDAGVVADAVEHVGHRHAQDVARDRAQRRLDQCQLGGQTGIHHAAEGLAEAELEVALEVDEVAQVQGHVRHLQRTEQVQAEVGVEADGDVQVLDVLDRTAQEIRRAGHVRDQVAQRGQAQAGEQTAGLGQLELQIEAGVQFDEVENTDGRVQAQTQRHGIGVELEGVAGGADRHAQATARHLAEIDVARRHRIIAHLHQADVEAQHQVGGLQRQERIGADDAGEIRLRVDAEEIDGQRDAGRGRRTDHRHRHVQVVDGQADGVVIGGIAMIDDTVAVAVGAIRTVDAGKGIDVVRDDDQRIARRRDVSDTRDHVVDRVQRALLEGDTALQCQNAGDVDHRPAHRGLDDGVVVIDQHRRATGLDVVTRPGVAGAILAEIGDETVEAAGVDADGDVVERQLEVILETDEADAVGLRLQRRELGALRDQRRRRIGDDVLLRRGEDAQTEIEVADPEADGVVAQITGIDAAVIVAVADRPADADEGMHVVGTDLDAVGLYPGDLAAQRALDRQFGTTTTAEGEIARHVHELGNRQQRVADARLDERRAGEIEQDGRGAGGDLQSAGGAETGLEVDHRTLVRHALPAGTPVCTHLDVLTGQFENALAAGHHELAGRGIQRGHLRDLQIGVGRGHDRQADVDVAHRQAEQAILLA